MPTLHARAARLTLFTLALGIVSCGPKATPIATGVPPAGPDVDPPADVTLNPDVVIVHGGASVIQQVSTDHGTWTVDKSAKGMSNLEVGKILLVAGVDCARVTAMVDQGSTLELTMAPVSVGEVIQDGKTRWSNLALDMSKAYLGRVPYELTYDAPCSPDAGGLEDGGAADGGTCHNTKRRHERSDQVSINIGSWTVSATTETAGDGVDLTATLQYMPVGGATSNPGDPSSTLGGISASVDLKSHIANVNGSSGSLSVSGGEITDSDLSADVGGYVDVDVSVSTPMGSQFPKSALVRLPIAAELPFACWAGIPCYVSFQAAILLQPSLATANSVLGLKTHVDLSGTAGMTFSGDSASATSMPDLTTPDNLLKGDTAPAEVGNMAMVFAIQAPRFGIGVGTMGFALGAKAGLFVDVVNSFSLTVAGATSLLPCQAATWDATAHGGGEMNIVLLGNTATFTHQIDLVSFKDPGTWYSPMVDGCKP